MNVANSIIIANTDEFDEPSEEEAGYDPIPWKMRSSKVPALPPTLRRGSAGLEDSGLDLKNSDRYKNFFALGMIIG